MPAAFLLKAFAVGSLVMMCTSAHSEPTPGQPVSIETDRPILIGRSLTIRSRVMGGKRTINVWLPEDTTAGGARYPVLYLLDGGIDQDFVHVVGASQLGAIWGRSRPSIIVGIASEDRRNELVGPTSDVELLKKYPSAGGSARFRRFIADEVKPLIEARYRTNGDDGIMGESLAGLFVVETWLREPKLFKRYAAISPSLWWDNEHLRSIVSAGNRRRLTEPPILFAIEAEEAGSTAIAERFLAVLPPSKGICYAPQPYNHANIYHAITPMALQFLFPPPEPPDPKFGFSVQCSKKS